MSRDPNKRQFQCGFRHCNCQRLILTVQQNRQACKTGLLAVWAEQHAPYTGSPLLRRFLLGRISN